MDRTTTDNIVAPRNYTKEIENGPLLLLAVPEEIKNPVRSISYPKSRLIIPVQGLQATANCTQIPPVNINSKIVPAKDYTAAHIKVKFSLSQGGLLTTNSISVEITLDKGPFARYIISHNHGSEAGNIVIAGYLHPDEAMDLSVVLCKPYLDRINAALALTYPDRRTDHNKYSEPELNHVTRQFVGSLNMSVDIHEPSYTDNRKFEDYGMIDGFFGSMVDDGMNFSATVRDLTLLEDSVQNLYTSIAA
ncbi:uncharacterized protein K452DRAFT_363323 [Aplosporella prunicola CBS 121167]|uniref:Uncharacterized protein n=1 Tax=Aplosporella prunicola CBS 121167 TaxID=1176127 RepID=A0A6A6ASW8_9PEZI|nr:uncharacterized protein K452DRAFT_363323 [Aplosporella prunicola CBS 121167]KAF2135122.1 hypothetical protein K452DRAFT_363323 [Aplosporella prunicola CBS 121167]